MKERLSEQTLAAQVVQYLERDRWDIYQGLEMREVPETEFAVKGYDELRTLALAFAPELLTAHDLVPKPDDIEEIARRAEALGSVPRATTTQMLSEQRFTGHILMAIAAMNDQRRSKGK